MTSDPVPASDPISIIIDCLDWTSALADIEAITLVAARAALAGACPGFIDPAGISVLLTDDAALQALNREWRGKDSPTNVLSFPATETAAGSWPEPEFAGVPLELGDIALAYETCDREARAGNLSLADHASHLVVHGVLHLLGYDHEADDDAVMMEALETRILAGLGIADPYAPALRPTLDPDMLDPETLDPTSRGR